MHPIHFVGCGGAFNPALGNNSAYISLGKQLILIDCGENIFTRLVKMEAFQKAEEIHLLLTHLHSDHVGSLGSMLSYVSMVSNQRCILYHPERKNLVALLDLLGIRHDFYELRDALEAELPGAFKARFIPVEHASDMTCYGIDVACEEPTDRFYFSGDAANLPEPVRSSFINGEIRWIYQDCSPKAGPGHMYYRHLIDCIPASERSRVCVMHLASVSGEKNYLTELKGAGFVLASELIMPTRIG